MRITTSANSQNYLRPLRSSTQDLCSRAEYTIYALTGADHQPPSYRDKTLKDQHTLLAALILGLTACGSADDNTGDTTPFTLSERAPTPRYDERPMSLETYLWAHWRLFHEYYCALAYRSLHVPYGDANSYDRMLAAGSETACRNLPELLWYTSDAVALAAVERGAYAYDPEEAARCIEATRAVGDPLTWYNRRIASCSRVFTPLLGEGEPCSTDSQCGGALHCNGPSNEVCTGRCAVKRCGDDLCERGEDCDETGTRCVRRYDAECGPDLSACDGDLVCQDGRCTSATPPQRRRPWAAPARVITAAPATSAASRGAARRTLSWGRARHAGSWMGLLCTVRRRCSATG